MFESSWSLQQLVYKIVAEKTKNKQKEGTIGPFLSFLITAMQFERKVKNKVSQMVDENIRHREREKRRKKVVYKEKVR